MESLTSQRHDLSIPIPMALTGGNGQFLKLLSRDAPVLAKACGRAVPRRVVDKGLLGREAAEGMLRWPHAGFEVRAMRASAPFGPSQRRGSTRVFPIALLLTAARHSPQTVSHD